MTYLLIKSRSPGQVFRTRAQETLQALQLKDAELNREVLMTRAGLLTHYDSLPLAGRALLLELQTLDRESTALAEDGDPTVARETRALTDAVSRKRYLVDHFTSDYAVLRNSTTYFAYLVQLLTRDSLGRAASPRAVDAAHVLMQLAQSPHSVGQERRRTALARIHDARLHRTRPVRWRLMAGSSWIFFRGGRRAASHPDVAVGARVEAVQQALLRSAGAAEARAQRFRVLLYGSALVLLAYL